ncbi:MAG TPA: ABC transporter ATP-binding protein [Chryseolinea sp.]|nr:ABC transporter ATP-binding protein [Chryseolinea sp.]
MVEKLKQLIKKHFKHLAYFYSHLRYRFFLANGLSLAVAVLDGLGIAMFLPLLQVAGGEGNSFKSDDMGNLRFLVDGMEHLGFHLTLVSVMSVMVLFFSLKGVARFFDAWYRVVNLRFFMKKVRFENIDALVKYDYKAFVTSDVGRIQNTLSGETNKVGSAYRSYASTVQTLVLVLVYTFMAFLANAQFALMVVIGGALSNVLYQQIYKRTKQASKQLTFGAHNFQGLLIQKVAFFKYLKATALIIPYSKKLKDVVNYTEGISKKMGMYNAVLSSTREPLVVLVVVAVISIEVTYFSTSIGLMLLSLAFFYRSLSFLMVVQNNWNQFMQNSGSLDNMQEFVHELRVHKEINGKESISAFVDSLQLHEAAFGYNGVPVLRQLNLKVKRNETVAFVGESGSGKTTIVNIMSGLLSVDEGSFLIDGKDSRRLDIHTYQRRIGYITQDPVIFSDTVFNNVTFWDKRTPEVEKRFWIALQKASIIDFVRALPDGENSFLGNNGILVSGGQKQRFSIARELYKEIDILIMDEATSALDSETERAVQESIEALKGQYTILIVAHRISTIKNVDKVVLLDNGRIEEVGSFDYLKNNSRIFENMVKLQQV